MASWFLLSVVALVFWGITGVTQKLTTRQASSSTAFVWFTAAFVAGGLAILIANPVTETLSVSTVALAALGGVLNGGGALTSFAALESGGKASVVIPLVSIYPVVTFVGSWLWLGETLNGRQAIGSALAILAVVLLSRETEVQPFGQPGKNAG